MAKKSGQKRKKEEKAKTQLKKQKTGPGNFLPKGTNVTKTEFKVGKITIPKQLEKVADEGPVTKKKLGLKEVLIKLGHFSQSVRFESLEGVKELVSGESGGNLVDENLSMLVTRLAPLTSDRDGKVRKSAFAILQAILSKANERKLEPLFPVLTAHVSCCLTHIEPSIQQDGLHLIDSLVDSAPTFIAANYARILPDCLEQISAKRGGDGTKVGVSAKVSEKIGSLQLRTQVLSRVDKVLGAVLGSQIEESSTGKTSKCSDSEFSDNLVCPIYPQSETHLGLADLTRKSGEDPMVSIVNHVLPLILESWIEATSEGKSQRVSFLQNEVFALLENLSQILDKLITYSQRGQSRYEEHPVLSCMKSKYYSELQSRVIRNLPYSSSNGKCFAQNALLCNVAISLDDNLESDTLEKIMSVVGSSSVQSDQRLKVLGKLLRRDVSQGSKEFAVNTLIEMTQDKTLTLSQRMNVVKLLSSLAECDTDLGRWMETLPSYLLTCATADSIEVCLLLETMLKFAKQRNQNLKLAFMKHYSALRDWSLNCASDERIPTLLSFISRHYS